MALWSRPVPSGPSRRPDLVLRSLAVARCHQQLQLALEISSHVGEDGNPYVVPACSRSTSLLALLAQTLIERATFPGRERRRVAAPARFLAPGEVPGYSGSPA